MSKHASSREDPSIAQDELRPVIEAVRQYGEAHPGILEQIWFDGPPHRVVALLAADDVTNHEAALRGLVGFPEHLEIKHSQWPMGHLDRIREEIVESVQGAISSIGLGKGVLGVRLWADQTDIAASLHERYGPALVLTVGHFPYPDIGLGNNRYLDVGPEQPDWASLPDEVFLSLEENIEIRSGSYVNSQLTIRNESTMEIVAGKLMPPIVDLASSRVIGGYEGAITAELRRFQVPAGASKEVPILIGTASTRPDLGYAVPPGLWAIRVGLLIGDGGFQRNVPIEILP